MLSQLYLLLGRFADNHLKKSIMKKILLFIAVCFSINANSQIILKSKKLQERIDLIKIEIEKSNYETAMNLFFEKDTLITDKEVKSISFWKPNYKKDYQRIDSILESKKNLFK